MRVSIKRGRNFGLHFLLNLWWIRHINYARKKVFWIKIICNQNNKTSLNMMLKDSLQLLIKTKT